MNKHATFRQKISNDDAAVQVNGSYPGATFDMPSGVERICRVCCGAVLVESIKPSGLFTGAVEQ